MIDGAVAFDLQATQDVAFADRGVARYTWNLARALDRSFPGVIGAFVLNRDLPRMQPYDELATPVVFADDLAGDDIAVWHATAPFNAPSIDAAWPLPARRDGARLVVTVYDLIKSALPEHYLGSPDAARRYLARCEFIRRADRIGAISRATAWDCTRYLGIAHDRVSVIGAGVGEEFQPASDPAAVLRRVTERFPSLRSGYVLYVGGVDPRKNVARLIDAYAAVTGSLRDSHQLVIACELAEPFASPLRERVSRLGLDECVVFTGRVAGSELVELYQAATLFVFPSLYEGYGLPVTEARACGVPVIAAANSSLVEMLSPEEACFDASDTTSITGALGATLASESRRQRLASMPSPARPWRDVAAAAADVYERAQALGRRPRSRRLRVAYASPIPPAPSGIAAYSIDLLRELQGLCEVDVFFDGPGDPASVPHGVHAHNIEFFEQIEAIRGGYDRVVYCIGNQTFHGTALRLLQQRPGTVIAHDVRLTGLYAWAARFMPELAPGGFHAVLHEMYGDRLPEEVGRQGSVDHTDADRYRVFMARDVVHFSTRYLAHSTAAARAAEADALPQDRDKIGVLPFAFASRRVARLPNDDAPLIASFGVVDPIKRSPMILEAFAAVASRLPRARLVFAGPQPESVRAEYARRAAELGVADRVAACGWVDDATYAALLGEASVAVQLRASSGGESSAALGDCLAAGVPAVVSDVGFVEDLPDGCVHKVPVDIDAPALADVIVALLAAPERLADLSRRAAAYAADHTFARVASALYDELCRRGRG